MPYHYRPGRIRRRFRPSPAVVVPGKWEVKDSRSGVARADVTHLKMEVPQGPDLSDWVVRTHEMAHVAYTPEGDKTELVRAVLPDADPIDIELTGLFEDVRVNRMAYRNLRQGGRFAMQYLTDRKEEYKKAKSKAKGKNAGAEELIRFAQLHALLSFCDHRKTPKRKPRGKAGQAAYLTDKICRDVLQDVENFDQSVIAARRFKIAFFPPHHGEFPENDQNPIPVGDRDELDRPVQSYSVTLAQAMDVKIEMVKYPTPHRKDKLIGLSYKPQDSGIVPKHIHRIGWGPVFTNKIRHQGGALLLDTSGSMRLSMSQILELMKKAPLATIALYSGDGGTGYIRIVAKNGRIAKEEDITRNYGCNNTCDCQALEWLGKQNGPRLWISDGMVNGKDGRMYPVYTREANRLMLVHNITRAENIPMALDMMDRRRLMVKDGAGAMIRYVHEGEPT